MEPTSNSLESETTGVVPVERRPILLRGYVETDSPKRDRRPWRQPPSEYVLFFDTETTPDAAQQLRFGCYQVCQGDQCRERGIFYDPGNVKPTELSKLHRVANSRGHRLLTASDFVDRVFYPVANAGALIV